MGLFSGLFKSRDKPKNSTVGSSYSFYMGGSTSCKPVNERSAMQMTAVYSCVRILAEAVAGLPLHLYRQTGSGGKEKATDHPLYLLLHDEPNPEMSSFVFRETLMTHLLLWGNAYAQIIRNGKNHSVFANAHIASPAVAFLIHRHAISAIVGHLCQILRRCNKRLLEFFNQLGIFIRSVTQNI